MDNMLNYPNLVSCPKCSNDGLPDNIHVKGDESHKFDCGLYGTCKSCKHKYKLDDGAVFYFNKYKEQREIEKQQRIEEDLLNDKIIELKNQARKFGYKLVCVKEYDEAINNSKNEGRYLQELLDNDPGFAFLYNLADHR